MKQTETEMLLAYFLNYSLVLEDDLRQLRGVVRYRPIDPVDCLELSLAIERKNAFDNFCKNVRAILHLSGVDPEGNKFEKEIKEDV